jgi:hypothetical protein
MEIGHRGALIVCLVIIIFGVHMIADRRPAGPGGCERTLPENIALDRDLERVLAKIYRASSTFRSQCDLIGSTSTLSVTLQIDAHIPRSCLAYTRFSRKGRALYADVHLPPSGTMMSQLVGHEFEHIVEQIEGVNLRSLARIPRSGVYESSFNVFESVRAQNAGMKIQREALAPRQAD